MLNEYLEFEAYVTDPTSPTPRVQPKLLTDHFKKPDSLISIEQIMTVIARAFIFSDGRIAKDGLISQQAVEDTKELLHRWTGFSDSEHRKRTANTRVDEWMEKHFVEDGWLKKYWTFQFDKINAAKKKSLSKEKNWETLEKKWNKRFNSGLDYSENLVTYNNMIANALEAGPLQNHYLVVRKDLEPKEKPVKANKRFKYLSDASSRQEPTDMKIMKIVAAYLLHLKYHPAGQKEVWLRNGELGNWYGMDDGQNGNETFYPKDATWKGRPIYTHHTLRGKIIKVSVNQDYLEEFDYKIIDISDAEQYRDTHWILEDLGHKLTGCWGIK